MLLRDTLFVLITTVAVYASIYAPQPILPLLAGEFGLEKLIAEVHLQAQSAFNAFKKAGFSVKAVFEDLVKDLSGKSSDLVVMICDVQARDK